MRLNTTAAVLCAVALALAGCGGGGGPSEEEKQEVLQVLDDANRAFAAGDFERTCSYYTPDVRKQLISLYGTRTCAQAWERIDQLTRKLVTPAEFDAITSYAPDEAIISGDAARATYGPPPPGAPRNVGPSEGSTIELRRPDDRWLIASVIAIKR